MGKYEQLAKDIIKNVGGKENVAGLTHCVTRLRFVLVDEKKANDEAVKNLKGVITLMKSAGQYQIVIGNHVPQVYADVCDVAGISASTNVAPAKKLSAFDTVVSTISGIFNPCLGVLCASGMVKGFLALFVFMGLMNEAQGLYQILYACGDALFYFFPILLGFSSATKFGMQPYLGAVIGAALVYPALQGVDINVFGLVINVTYASTVLPIILTNLLAAFVEKQLKKFIPDVIKTFVVPMVVLFIAVPIGFCAIGPVANLLSTAIADGIMAIYNFSPILAGLILGGFWQVLVIFGIHMGLAAVGIVALVTTGATPIFSIISAASFSQTAVVFVIWMKTHDQDLKGLSLSSWISGIFGVTEPAIYGITLPRIKFFVISCIGAAISGAYIAQMGVMSKIMGGMGVFAFPSFLAQGGNDLMHILIGTAIGMVFSFVVTFMLYNDTNEKKGEIIDDYSKKIDIKSPIVGKVIELEKVQDGAFSQGALGKGVAILPEIGEVHAPVTGKVTTLFPTLHAVGITSDEGVEVLIHVGLNTVQLEGKYFSAKCTQGDHVKIGDLLVTFDIDSIIKAGYNLETPVVICNTNDYLDVVATDLKSVKNTDDLITVLR